MSVYARDVIESFIPAIWDEAYALEGKDPLAPEQGAPKSKADPSHGNGKLAMICDVQQAWRYADLELEERQAVIVRFGMDETYESAARILGETHQMTVHRRCTRGIAKLGRFLNGGKDWPAEPSPSDDETG